MRFIQKGEEPRSLVEHRLSSYADYENYADKEALRARITAEQRGLCCYCLARIPGARGMKVEHWHCQAIYPSEQLSYSNMLGACTGNERMPWRFQHCDTRKGDRELSRNPANRDDRVEDLIRYGADGTIASDDAAFDHELNEVLNLNEPRLKNNRKATLDGFLKAAPGSGQWRLATLHRFMQEWNGETGAGELIPFCQVVVYWLRKRLARA